MPPRILVVHDPQIAVRFLGTLKSRGFEVDWTESRTPAAVALSRFQPSLVLLDVGRLNGDCNQSCAEWRRQTSIPIIGFAAPGRRDQLITALNLGADDCVDDQCDVDELVERVGAVLRRSTLLEGTAQFGTLRIDFDRIRAWNGDTEIHDLTYREFKLLACLVQREGKAVSRENLLREIWGYSTAIRSRCVDHAINRLRKKLISNVPGTQLIDKVRGCGYRARLAT